MPIVDAEQQSLVQLELTYSREMGGRDLGGRSTAHASRLEADAHFVRYRTTDRAIDARAVAGLLGLPSTSELDIDTCELERSAGAVAPGALEVALLDAGALTVRSDEVPLAVLEPHAYPELLPFVTGVVYGAEVAVPEAASSPFLRPQARVGIEAQGGEDVGPFLASAEVPQAFPDLNVAVTRSDLELRWSQGSASQSTVAIELRWVGEQPGLLRCRARDDGHFLVPRATSAQLDRALTDGSAAQVSVARSAQAGLAAPGAGPGQVIVTLRDVISTAGLPQP